MSIEVVTLLIFVALLVLIAMGLPIAFCLGAVGTVFALALWGPDTIGILAHNVWQGMKNFLMIFLPLLGNLV